MQNIENHHRLYVEQLAKPDEQIENSENIYNEEESQEVLLPHGKTFDGQWQYNAHGLQHFTLRHLIRIFREVISEMRRVRNQLHY
jgi:hypothetical protein